MSAEVPVPVARLRQAIASSRSATHAQRSTLWDVVLSRKISSEASEEGIWMAWPPLAMEVAAAHEVAEPRCVAQIIPDTSAPTDTRKIRKARINLFHCISKGVDSDACTTDDHIRNDVCSTLNCAMESLASSLDNESQRIALTFGSLDRYLVLHVRHALQANPELFHHKFFSTFTSQCGMWIHEADDKEQGQNPPTLADQSLALSEGVVIRPLMQTDAELVNSKWEYKSDGSLEMIQKMIATSEAKGGCVGLAVNGTLVSWMLRYLDGSIGMLFTEENHRRKGYAAIVVNGVVSDMRSKSQKYKVDDDCIDTDRDRMISYIVDSNEASKNLYIKLGWKRVSDADWIGFASRQPKYNKQLEI